MDADRTVRHIKMRQSFLWLFGRRFSTETKICMPTAMVILKSEIYRLCLFSVVGCNNRLFANAVMSH